MSIKILTGDALTVLRRLPDASVNACITSPPYFGLRSYLPADHPAKALEMGLEETPDAYVERMVELFREVRRVLVNEGVLWLNIGDSYAGSGKGGNPGHSGHIKQASNLGSLTVRGVKREADWLKPKDMIGIPWLVAFALRNDGWYLRQWLPWIKANPMPESVTDRPSASCEVVFLLTKSATYHYDYEAVRRTMAASSAARLAQDVEKQAGSLRANGGAKTNGPMKAVAKRDKQADTAASAGAVGASSGRRMSGFNERWDAKERASDVASPRHAGHVNHTGISGVERGERAFRNSDLFYESLQRPYGAIGNDEEIIALDVATRPFFGAHYAVFPPNLIEPLVLAGCPKGGTVLDPFFGAGTTGLVADRLGRNCIGIDLLEDNVEMAAERIRADSPMLALSLIHI